MVGKRVEYLGRTIDGAGVPLMQAAVAAIAEGRPSKNHTELKLYLGLLIFHGDYIPSLSFTLTPLK